MHRLYLIYHPLMRPLCFCKVAHRTTGLARYFDILVGTELHQWKDAATCHHRHAQTVRERQEAGQSSHFSKRLSIFHTRHRIHGTEDMPV